MSVILNPADGWAQIGSLQVNIELTGNDGSLQIDGDSGACLAPISFMERSRIVSYASVSKQPTQAMAKLINDSSLVTAASDTNTTDPAIISIIALALAGANINDLPSFAESLLLVSQQSGWTPEQLLANHALEIDQLTQQLLAEEDIDDGWVHLKFEQAGTDDLAQIQDELANNLLTRLYSDKDQQAVTHAKQTDNDLPTDSSNKPLQPAAQLANDLNKSLATSKKEQITAATAIKNTEIEAVASPATVANNAKKQSLSDEFLSLLSPLLNNKKIADETIVSKTSENIPTNNATVLFKPDLFAKNRTEWQQGSALTKPTLANRQNTSLAQSVAATRLTEQHSDTATLLDTRATATAASASFAESLAESALTLAAFNTVEDQALPADVMPATNNTTKRAAAASHSNTQKTIAMDDFFDELAIRLHLEADMRGIDR